jgi:hypothetical protein
MGLLDVGVARLEECGDVLHNSHFASFIWFLETEQSGQRQGQNGASDRRLAQAGHLLGTHLDCFEKHLFARKLVFLRQTQFRQTPVTKNYFKMSMKLIFESHLIIESCIQGACRPLYIMSGGSLPPKICLWMATSGCTRPGTSSGFF